MTDPAPASPRRLRIAYVQRHFNDSGSLPAAFRARAEELSRYEDVTVVTSSASRAETDAPLRFETVDPIVVGEGRISYAAECASFAFRATRRLRKLRSRFDVVHVDGFTALEGNLVTVHAVRPDEIDHYFDNIEPRARLRRRLTPLLRPQSGVVKAAERRLFRAPYPVCLPISSRIADALRRHYDVPEELVEVLPYGIDVAHFRFDPESRHRERAALKTPETRLVLLFVGDDFERKGLDRAICSLARAAQDAELWVAGNGDQTAFLALARSLGVADRTHFLGRIANDRLAGLFSGSDVFVLPSRQDAWGIPAIEAMAAGRVVLVSNFAGVAEAVRPGETGYVLDGDGGGEEIAALLDGPLADPELRAAVGRRASAGVGRFDRTAIFPRFRAAHHRAAALRAARAQR